MILFDEKKIAAVVPHARACPTKAIDKATKKDFIPKINQNYTNSGV